MQLWFSFIALINLESQDITEVAIFLFVNDCSNNSFNASFVYPCFRDMPLTTALSHNWLVVGNEFEGPSECNRIDFDKIYIYIYTYMKWLRKNVRKWFFSYYIHMAGGFVIPRGKPFEIFTVASLIPVYDCLAIAAT